jgi:hypothetical protein
MTLKLVHDQSNLHEIPWWVGECLQDETEQRRIYVTKGLGAGGTYGLAIWHYIRCLNNRRSRLSWSIAPTFQQVADTLIPTFGEVLQDVFCLEEGVDYSIVSSGRPRIELHNTGQQIDFKSANRPDRMVGANVSHISGTEPGLWNELAFEKPSARLRCPKAKVRQWLMEGTPEGLGNPYEKRANFNEGVNEKTNARRIILHTADNIALPSSYVPALEQTYSYDAAKLESYLFGRFVPFTKGTAYWEFKHSRNVVLDVQISPQLPLLWCWDFNKSPLAWVLMQRQPHERRGYRYHRYVALAESNGQARGIMDAVAEFVTKVPPSDFAHTPIEVYGDPSGYFGSHLAPGDAYDQIMKYARLKYQRIGVQAHNVAPDVRERLERVNQLMVYQQFVVGAWCRNLIRSLEQTSLKAGLWEILKPKKDDVSHWGDAVGYPLFQLTRGFDLENPSPTIYGMNV